MHEVPGSLTCPIQTNKLPIQINLIRQAIGINRGRKIYWMARQRNKKRCKFARPSIKLRPSSITSKSKCRTSCNSKRSYWSGEGSNNKWTRRGLATARWRECMSWARHSTWVTSCNLPGPWKTINRCLRSRVLCRISLMTLSRKETAITTNSPRSIGKGKREWNVITRKINKGSSTNKI